MTLNKAGQKVSYWLAAAAILLALLGTPLVTSPIHAGDCPTIGGNSC